MRFISKLTMTVAAIFFAVSVSAGDVRNSQSGTNDDQCVKSQPLGKKAYQVCKSWREDQGGPMPTNMMQHGWNTLCTEADKEFGLYSSSGCTLYDENGARCVNDDARARAKVVLGYW